MKKSDKLFDKGWKQLIKKGNSDRGMEYMHRAAEEGSDAAVVLMAELYLRGNLSLGTEGGVGDIRVDKDVPRALNLLEQLPQAMLVSYIEALQYYLGAPGVKKDYNKAYALFKSIAQNTTEPEFEDISLLYDFEYGERTEEIDAQIKRTSVMYYGVMQFYGRGVPRSDEAAYKILKDLDDKRIKSGIKMSNYWYPEHAFVLEVLKYNNAARDEAAERELSSEDFDNLMWMLRGNYEPQVRKILAERLIAPPLKRKLMQAARAKQIKEINMGAKIAAELKSITENTDWETIKTVDEALIYYGEPDISDPDARIYEDSLSVLSKAGDLMATVMLTHFELTALDAFKDHKKHYRDSRQVNAIIKSALNDMAGQISAYANTDPGDDEYALKTLKNGLNAAGQFLSEYREEAEQADKEAFENARYAYYGEEEPQQEA